MKPLEPVVSEVDKRSETVLSETTKLIGCHYETGSLSRTDEIHFCEAKIAKDNNFKKWYKDKINEYNSTQVICQEVFDGRIIVVKTLLIVNTSLCRLQSI